MTTIYLDPNPTLTALGTRLYNYKGRKFQAVTAESVTCESHWDGGSRSRYIAVDVTTGQAKNFGQSGTMFDRNPVPVVELRPGLMVVEHAIVMGKDYGITLHLHPSDFPKFLPAAPGELPTDEKIVLCATRSYKSSYSGQSNYRFHEACSITGISRDRWETAKSDLIIKGLLNKAGALTNVGKNAIGWVDLYGLKSQC